MYEKTNNCLCFDDAKVRIVSYWGKSIQRNGQFFQLKANYLGYFGKKLYLCNQKTDNSNK